MASGLKMSGGMGRLGARPDRREAIMAKHQTTKTAAEGRHICRGKNGKFRADTIIGPKKGPTSISLKQIRTAIRETHVSRAK